MERTVMAELVKWKSRSRRKPLMLLGARQVGKTWLLQELAKNNFSRTLTVNFDKSEPAKSVFDRDLDVRRIVSDLAILDGGGPVDAATTLIILDEIQEAPQALASLKYFAEDAPEFYVACAGSLLGIAAHQHSSFPVGKVNIIDVYPLTFVEYLDALEEPGLADLIRTSDMERFAPFHDLLVSHLRSFLFVGGMPEAVAEYAPHRDVVVAREVQKELLAAYDRDFSKHAPPAEVPRLRALFDSVPRQLARENKRFVYGQAERGARAKTMEMALQWLLDAGLVHQVRRLQVPRIPLAAYIDESAFKLYFLDVGLTGAAVGLEARTLLEGSTAFTEYKGALTEQYVLQELVADSVQPFCWTSRSGGAEVDFVVQADDVPMPIEVKAEVNVQAKSLRVFREQYAPPRSVRLSLRPYRDEGWLVNVPLYAAGRAQHLRPPDTISH